MPPVEELLLGSLSPGGPPEEEDAIAAGEGDGSASSLRAGALCSVIEFQSLKLFTYTGYFEMWRLLRVELHADRGARTY